MIRADRIRGQVNAVALAQLLGRQGGPDVGVGLPDLFLVLYAAHMCAARKNVMDMFNRLDKNTDLA